MADAAPPLPEPNIYRPATRRNARRVVQRGDLGTAPADGRFPAQSAHAALRDAWRELASTRPCNPDAEREMPGLPPEVRDAPPEQQCIRAVGVALERASQRVRARDRRTGKMPRPADAGDPAASGRLEEWDPARSRPELAKRCLDAARRMFGAGEGIMRTALELRDPARRASELRRGSGLIYVTQGGPQTPKPNRVSALWLAYVAYRLVRDTEVNPRAPDDPMRATEDADYRFIMGARRMQPNRLGDGGAPAPDDPAGSTTDMARCLLAIHTHFPPNTARVDGVPLAQRVRSWAEPGRPYPPGESPFADTMPADYVPVFFPSGRSRNPARAEPPYEQIDPTPAAGVPDVERAHIWDARAAVAQLQTHAARLRAAALLHAADQQMRVERERRRADPDAALAATPPALWEGGPRPRARDLAAAGLAAALPAELGMLEAPARVDAALAAGTLPDGRPSVVRDVRADRARVPTGSVYPGGVPLAEVPEPVDARRLPHNAPGTTEARQRMLQHALFQLDAPLTPWMRANHAFDGVDMPPPPQPRTWGVARPDRGLRRRALDGTWLPGHRGWAALRGPPRRDGGGGGELSLDVRAGYVRALRGRSLTLAHDAVVVGPLLVDPLFGETAARTPSVAYAADVIERSRDAALPATERPQWLWFVRTDQARVDGDETWGLDFYLDAAADQLRVLRARA